MFLILRHSGLLETKDNELMLVFIHRGLSHSSVVTG